MDHRGTAKLGDFGLAAPEGEWAPEGHGTLPYAAPEVLAQSLRGYTVHRAQDLWSLGIVIYVLLAGDFPWLEASPRDAEYAAFLAGDRAAGAWRTFSPPLRALLEQLLHPDPARRGEAADVFAALAHVWVPHREPHLPRPPAAPGAPKPGRRRASVPAIASAAAASSSDASGASGLDSGFSDAYGSECY